MNELPEEIAKRVIELSETGNDYLDNESNWQEALRVWEEALSLLPSPKEDWDAYLWLICSIGEAYFEGEVFDKSLECFKKAKALDDKGNPYILYRIGSNYFEVGQKDNAKKYFQQVIDAGVDEIFVDDEDYIEFMGLFQEPEE